MKYSYLGLFFLFSPILLIGQGIENVPRITTTIQLDGLLTEEIWSQAYELTNFKQIAPNLGADATENASVKIMYDDNYLYVGGISLFSDPSQIFATTLERDVFQDNDDYIEIHLDTYNDKINTLIFRTNPLGARQDLEVSRNGEDFNTSWNTFWDAKSVITDTGWSTEIRIPFSSLRYQKSEENIMRIKAAVKYKEKNERIVSPLINAEIPSAIFHFSNAYEFRFTNLPSTKPLYITPYVKTNAIRENKLNVGQTAYESETTILDRKDYVKNETLDKILSNVGIDVKYKPNASHTIDFTLNTDFAEVEADDRIVNISRFPIFLPEKRLFFLENADLFNSNQYGHRLFHSRRIGIEDGSAVPIIGGLRFTGNSAGWQYGFLNMQTHKVEGLTESNNMSVARIRKSIGNLGSNIGILNTNKIGKNTSNHLVAIDGNLRLTNTFVTRFTLASTFDKITGNWKSMYGIDVNTFKNNGFGLNYRFRSYEDGFNPELGFVPRPNTKRITFNNGWRKTFKDPKFLRYISMGNYITKYWVSSSGDHEFFQTNLYLAAVHKNGYNLTMFVPMYQEDNLYSHWEISEGVVIPMGHHKMWKIEPILSSGEAYKYQFSIDAEIGEFYGGHQFSLTYNVSYDFSKLFQMELGGAYNKLNFPDEYTNNVSGNLNLSRYFSRMKFNLSSKATLNSYMQYDTRANEIGWNLRFRYNAKEGTDLYVVYNHNANTDRDILSPRLPFTNNQIFTIKFSKTFLN
jgi:hypothetical protein